MICTPRFDFKAKVAEYALSITDGPQVFDVQPGGFYEAFIAVNPPRKQEDGTFVLSMGVGADTKLPVIDTARDYGKYVVSAIENGGPGTIYAAPAYITAGEVAEEYSRSKYLDFFFCCLGVANCRICSVSGKQVIFKQLPFDDFEQFLASFTNEDRARCTRQMLEAIYHIGRTFDTLFYPRNILTPESCRLRWCRPQRE